MTIRTPYVVVSMRYASSLPNVSKPMLRTKAIGLANKLSKEKCAMGWSAYRLAKAMPEIAAAAYVDRYVAFDMCYGGAGGWT